MAVLELLLVEASAVVAVETAAVVVETAVVVAQDSVTEVAVVEVAMTVD